MKVSNDFPLFEVALVQVGKHQYPVPASSLRKVLGQMLRNELCEKQAEDLPFPLEVLPAEELAGRNIVNTRMLENHVVLGLSPRWKKHD